MKTDQEIKPVHKGSKFVFNSYTFELIYGKLPTKDGQLWNGEDHRRQKMQFAGNTGGDPTPYWGW